MKLAQLSFDFNLSIVNTEEEKDVKVDDPRFKEYDNHVMDIMKKIIEEDKTSKP